VFLGFKFYPPKINFFNFQYNSIYISLLLYFLFYIHSLLLHPLSYPILKNHTQFLKRQTLMKRVSTRVRRSGIGSGLKTLPAVACRVARSDAFGSDEAVPRSRPASPERIAAALRTAPKKKRGTCVPEGRVADKSVGSTCGSSVRRDPRYGCVGKAKPRRDPTQAWLHAKSCPFYATAGGDSKARKRPRAAQHVGGVAA
jgi:hypothetical protein